MRWNRDRTLQSDAPLSEGANSSFGGQGEAFIVLWVGRVVLGKGIQYLLEAARLLRAEGMQFVVAGPIGVARHIIETAPPNVHFLGRVNRSAVSELYAKADAFVFPTLSDGFGITQLEAMSHGLPVITTPNCGEVVTHGKDGLIVPPQDPRAIAVALCRLRDNPKELASLRRAAFETSQQFTLDRYAVRLIESTFPNKDLNQRQQHRWTVAQLGAREHYAVARGLNRLGILERLYTEAWCRYGSRLIRKVPGPIGAFGGRYSPEIESDRVSSFSASTLLYEARVRLAEMAKRSVNLYDGYVKEGKRFAAKLVREMAASDMSAARDALFTYTASLEALEWARERGIKCVLGQVDAARVHEEVVARECALWPGWQHKGDPIPDTYWERLYREWAVADIIVVNSAWSMEAIVQQGARREKIRVVPLAYERSD